MPKFSEKVPRRLNDEIGRIKINENVPKGVAIEYAMHLARLKPDVTRFDFGEDEDGICNLGLKHEQMAVFREFRSNHEPVLHRNGEFFVAALVIGATLYKQGYRLSSKTDFEGARIDESKANHP